MHSFKFARPNKLAVTTTAQYNGEQLRKMMDRNDYDVLVVRSGRNVAYLSGMWFPGTLGRLQDFTYSPRAALVVWPRDDDPTLIVSDIASGLARRESWIDDVQTYQEYVTSPYALAAETVAKAGVASDIVGVERREFGVTHWETFQSHLPDVKTEDCTNQLETVRNVKTPGEIERLERSVEIQDAAHVEVFEDATEGMTERELHTRMIESLHRRGADSAHGMMQSSSNPVTYGGESDLVLEQGDVLRTDYVSYFDGYAANLSRMAVVGEPSKRQRDRYATVRDVHRETISEMLRPGVEACEVYEFVRERLAERGHVDMAGLVGHSTGVWWHQEEPMLVPNESRLLLEDMVICLETIVDGFWHVQDQLVIGTNGAELLSDGFDTDELFVIE